MPTDRQEISITLPIRLLVLPKNNLDVSEVLMILPPLETHCFMNRKLFWVQAKLNYKDIVMKLGKLTVG